MIRDSLAVVVVARRHSERLSDTVAALSAENLQGSVTVVNLTGDSLTLKGTPVIDAAPTLSLSHAVDRALADSSAETVWILRDDTRVRPGAFTALASLLDTSPSVGVVGPKQMDAANPATIREIGESMTRSGFAIHLAERELDQAQYDRTSDVLAVGEAGMLVRRVVWTALGGFDPALPAVDGALDFCYRARCAGWLVEIVPNAVIDTAVTSFEALAGAVSDARVVVEESRSRAHRVLVYGSAVARPVVSLALVAGAFIRGLGRFIQKRSNPFAEWRGTLSGVTDFRAVGRAHRALRSIRTHAFDGTRLYVSVTEYRHRQALERDARRAIIEAGDGSPRLTFGAVGMWLTGLATVCGFVLAGRFIGSSALSGGALLPMPATFSETTGAIGATWSDVAGGIVGAPDGFASLMGILGSLTWWNPNLVVVALFVVVVPLSFVAGFVGAGTLTADSRTAFVVGAGWALLPTLHIAIAEGRITAVLAHIALPFFARAVSGTSIVALGWASISAAIVWTSVPALAPVIVLAVIVRAVTGNPIVLVTLVPALAFEWPRIIAAVANPVTYFADRGFPFPTDAPHGLASLTLWPGTPSLPFVPPEIAVLVAFVVVVTGVVLTVFSVIVADNPRVGSVLIVAGVALVTWAAIGTVPLSTAHGQPVGLFPGPLYDVVWFGLLAGTAITVCSLRSLAGFLAPLAVVVIAAVGIVPMTLIATDGGLVRPSTVRTLPAYVEAETAANPGEATLILTPTTEGLRAEIQRDAGVTLVDWTAAASTRTVPAMNEPAIADLVANLVVESGFDFETSFAKLGIRFILVEATPTAPEVSAIASHAGLTSVGVTDRGILWRVNTATDVAATNRAPDLVYRVILGLVGLVALIAAVPTSLPRRRVVVDDLIPLTEEDDDEHS